MAQLNIDNVKLLAAKAFIAQAQDAFGPAGAIAISTVLDNVRLIFRHSPPEALKATLTVICSISATPLSPTIATLGPPVKVGSHKELAKLALAATDQQHVVVEVASNEALFCVVVTNIDLVSIAANAVVYRFEQETDRVLAGTHDVYIPKVSGLLRSNFADPTLSGLEEALGEYANYALDSKCRILADVWEGGVDGPRLVLKNRPEAKMRDSLCQALELTLRDVTVRPEQNTDETKPVDIRVEWFGSGASALIEVKWLGRSTAKQQKPKPEPSYTDYDNKRAQDGANQLADYMDRQVRHSQATAPRGYLVVFDARRSKIDGPNDRLTKENAMFFVDKDLVFNPDHAQSRSDFARPSRFFLKPRESHFLAA